MIQRFRAVSWQCINLHTSKCTFIVHRLLLHKHKFQRSTRPPNMAFSKQKNTSLPVKSSSHCAYECFSSKRSCFQEAAHHLISMFNSPLRNHRTTMQIFHPPRENTVLKDKTFFELKPLQRCHLPVEVHCGSPVARGGVNQWQIVTTSWWISTNRWKSAPQRNG